MRLLAASILTEMSKAARIRFPVLAVKGDAADFARLVGFLDLEVKGFYMHQR